MLREQIKELRKVAENLHKYNDFSLQLILQQAADAIETLLQKDEEVLCKNHLPEISEEDLLLLVKDENNEYHYEIGYYRGKENNELMFDNCYHGWIQEEVISWKRLPKM